MSEEYSSYQLTDFNLKDHDIILSHKFGHLKIIRTEDGVLSLVKCDSYGKVDPEGENKIDFFHPDSTLGFILDIGIQLEKRMTYGHGFYFGSILKHSQSRKEVFKKDFDLEKFEKIGELFQSYSKLNDKSKEIEIIKLQSLIDQYNDARLLYPNFYAESYLCLMRILDALSNGSKFGTDFALFLAELDSSYNEEVFGKIKKIDTYSERITKAIDLFNDCSIKAVSEKWPSSNRFQNITNDHDKFIFSCFYSAYQYRNKFVHKGFKFPSAVKDEIGMKEDTGIAYLSPSLGQNWMRFYRPKEGVQEGDLIDIHEVVGHKVDKFKDIYFLLTPTWYFLKEITRRALFKKIDSM